MITTEKLTDKATFHAEWPSKVNNPGGWLKDGRSPIHGSMLIALDNRAPLPEEFIAMVSSPIEEWVPAEALTAIAAITGRSVAPDATVTP